MLNFHRVVICMKSFVQRPPGNPSIRAHGRWAVNSPTFQKYIRPTLGTVSAVCSQMAVASDTPLRNGPDVPITVSTQPPPPSGVFVRQRPRNYYRRMVASHPPPARHERDLRHAARSRRRNLPFSCNQISGREPIPPRARAHCAPRQDAARGLPPK